MNTAVRYGILPGEAQNERRTRHAAADTGARPPARTTDTQAIFEGDVVTQAPIAVFAFNRPKHLRRTLDSLCACTGFDQHPVTVYVDGPRSEADAAAVAEVQSVAREVLGSRADIRVSLANQGLAKSITGGVAEQLDQYGRVIVVEDDLKLAPGFLTFMSTALDRYADDPRVFQVSGYMFDVPEFATRPDAMFLPLTTTWGWATWSRAWKVYDPLATGWQRLLSDQELRRRFNFDGSYDFLSLMRRQVSGLSDSWGIRWYWSVFRHDGLCVFPPRSLVQNTGQDGSGTHGGGLLTNFSGQDLSAWPLPETPEAVTVSPIDVAAVRSAILRQNGGWAGRILSKAKIWVGR